jgi:hypothetical protein
MVGGIVVSIARLFEDAWLNGIATPMFDNPCGPFKTAQRMRSGRGAGSAIAKGPGGALHQKQQAQAQPITTSAALPAKIAQSPDILSESRNSASRSPSTSGHAKGALLIAPLVW